MNLKLIVFFFICIYSNKSYAQNEDKYWNYRARLTSTFLKIGEQQGNSIPAANTNSNQNHIKWSDATIDLGWYIGVLATEHYLLKNEVHFQSNAIDLIDYQENIEELYFALKALERLDLYAESSFSSCPKGTNENGFFIRDDVPLDFHDNFSNVTNVISDFLSDDDYDKEMSQDQVYHLLIGLSLVQKFVSSDVEFEGSSLLQLATKLATNIAVHVVEKSNYVIRNPACHKNVDRGAEAFAFSYGISEAFKKTTNGIVNYENTFEVLINKNVWPSLGNPGFFIHFNADNTHMIMTLGAIGNVWRKNTLKRLMNLAKLQDFYLYPVLFAALYDAETSTDWAALAPELSNIAQHMIDDAPFDGNASPYPNQGTNSWASDNRFIRVKEEHISGSSNSQGQVYNGLDFMLLHNLNKIVFGCQTAIFEEPQTTTFCNNDNTIFDLSPFGQPEGGHFFGNGVENNKFNPSTSEIGTHKIFYEYESGLNCISRDSIEMIVETCTNIFTNELQPYLIYPNPTHDKLNITIRTKEKFDYLIYDFNGKLLLNGSLALNQNQIDFSKLSKGIYVFKIYDSIKDKYYTQKVLKY